jgi:hypothetical protein
MVVVIRNKEDLNKLYTIAEDGDHFLTYPALQKDGSKECCTKTMRWRRNTKRKKVLQLHCPTWKDVVAACKSTLEYGDMFDVTIIDMISKLGFRCDVRYWGLEMDKRLFSRSVRMWDDDIIRATVWRPRNKVKKPTIDAITLDILLNKEQARARRRGAIVCSIADSDQHYKILNRYGSHSTIRSGLFDVQLDMMARLKGPEYNFFLEAYIMRMVTNEDIFSSAVEMLKSRKLIQINKHIAIKAKRNSNKEPTPELAWAHLVTICAAEPVIAGTCLQTRCSKGNKTSHDGYRYWFANPAKIIRDKKSNLGKRTLNPIKYADEIFAEAVGTYPDSTFAQLWHTNGWQRRIDELKSEAVRYHYEMGRDI